MVEAITKYIKEYESFEADRVTNGPLRLAARRREKNALRFSMKKLL